MTLTGQTVMITGASRGIGAAAAHAFAEAGARVALVARSGDALSDLARDLGDAALALPCDVASWPDMQAAAAATRDRLGGPDILINNAGVIAPIAHITRADPEAWSQAIDINLKGVFFGIRAVLPGMRKAGGGTIITISSGAASHPIEAWSHYCASKAGAAMLTRCLDLEERGHGIRAMGLSPGTVATQMQRDIKASGINPVSQLNWSDHIPPDWPARTLVWMCGPGGDAHLGQEISLRDPAIRKAVGLA